MLFIGLCILLVGVALADKPVGAEMDSWFAVFLFVSIILAGLGDIKRVARNE